MIQLVKKSRDQFTSHRSSDWTSSLQIETTLETTYNQELHKMDFQKNLLLKILFQ